MAGFMSGFGSAFANSYDKAIDRRKAREDEVFKYTFQAYLNGKEEKKKKKTKDSETLRLAKDIVTNERLPDDALGDVYNWLDIGYTPEQAMKRARSGSWSSKKDEESSAKSPEAAGDISADPTKASTEEQTSSALPMTVGGEDPTAVAPGAPEPGAVPAAQAEAPVPPASVAPDAAPAPAAVEAPAPAAPAPEASAPVEAAQAPAPTPEAPEPQMPMPRQMTDAFGRISSITGESPEAVQDTMLGADDTPLFQPSGRFQPGPPEVDFVSSDEAQFKFDQAVAFGDDAGKELYGNMLKAYEEQAEKEARAKGGSGDWVQWTDPNSGQVLTKAVQKTENGWMRTDGKGMAPENARVIGDDEKKIILDIGKNTEDGAKISAKQAKAMGLYGSSLDMIKLAQQNPAVLTAVGDISQWIAGANANVKAAVQVLSSKDAEPSAIANAQQTVDQELNAIDKALANTDVMDTAKAASLFQQKLLLMSYKAGDLEGQRGNSLNEKDYTRMQQILNASHGDPAVFAQGLQEYLKDLSANIDLEVESYNANNGQAQTYESIAGEGAAPAAAYLRPMEELFAATKDQRAKDAYEALQGEIKIDKIKEEKPVKPEGMPSYSTPEAAKKAMIDKTLRSGDQFWNGTEVIEVP